MKYYLILNPGSCGGKNRKIFKRIFSLLNLAKVDYAYEITQGMDDALRLSLKANKLDYDVIVAVGGDGTINRVVNGFYDTQGKRISKAKMGVIYTGTSPDFCKSYNIPYKNVDEAIRVLLENNSRPIQIAKITFADDSHVCYFSCCTNIGLGATLARYANSGIRKIAGDFLGTLVSLIRILILYHPKELLIRCDGFEQRLDRVFNLSIGKTFYIASGIKVKNDLKEGDGRFYLLTVKHLDTKHLPYCLKTIYSGREIPSNEMISLGYGKIIEIHGDSEVEFDGDPQGYLPCRIEMAEESLEIITKW
ncbi:MAG: diacylglycerol kinase [Candidatus Omnitrophica bacterium]|nr:diacylglycerol kinase [Candidatus Omnitrophota bacterium]